MLCCIYAVLCRIRNFSFTHSPSFNIPHPVQQICVFCPTFGNESRFASLYIKIPLAVAITMDVLTTVPVDHK